MQQIDPSSGISAASETGRGPRVLIVDDESVIRRFTSRVLADAGYLVVEACDGTEALEYLREAGGELDLVLSDVVMPGLNGVELLEALSTAYPGVPVLLMSGYASAELRERGIAAPCGILAKPFSAEQLLDEVRRCLAGRR